MRRRRFLQYIFGLVGAAASGVRFAGAVGLRRVRPGMAAWPTDAAWKSLGDLVGDRLQPVAAAAPDAISASQSLSNPFYRGEQPALTQSAGWVDAWQSAPSAYVLRARDASDVAAAVRFASAHRLRLVVKGGGHSYLGGSSAPDSLLVWTRAMNAITVHEKFVPQGCEDAPVPAVSVGAGCIWLHVYAVVTTQGGRYVQGGGCTTVGVAGLVQGGGFGSYSKAYGLAAASLVEAEIVTADGTTRVVNASHEPDLFWALKGGGGGTYGVVTRMTLRTHDLPEIFGGVRWTIQAVSDAGFRRLLARFIDCYRTRLFNPHWGEQVRVTPDNRLVIEMVFQDLDEAAARSAWQVLADFVATHPEEYKIVRPFLVLALPARHFWDEAFLHAHIPAAIAVDGRADAAAGDYWWAGDGEQAGALWHSYASAWLPARLLQEDSQARLVDAWFAASRHWSVAFHFNKGLAGAAAPAIVASRDTAMNPDVLDAFALAIVAGNGRPAPDGFLTPDMAAARANAAHIQAAMRTLREAAPDAGSYLSECDYFTQDWQQASWGAHWDRLSRIKRRYDPDGLFVVHHGVGSEAWSADGFTRLAAR